MLMAGDSPQRLNTQKSIPANGTGNRRPGATPRATSRARNPKTEVDTPCHKNQRVRLPLLADSGLSAFQHRGCSAYDYESAASNARPIIRFLEVG